MCKNNVLYYIFSSSSKGNSSDESLIHDSSDDDSSDDDKSWVKEMRKNYRTIKHNERIKEQENEEKSDNVLEKNEPKLEQATKSDEAKFVFEEGEPGRKKQNK